MSKHTPGPWVWHKAGNGHWKLWGNHGMRPIVLDHFRNKLRTRNDEHDLMVPFDPDNSNARLIAAAPEMLAALKLVSKACRDDQVSFEAIGAVDDAIFEAEGGEG